ncbi:hypothetical protein QA641_19500 [Bradyrhizobium sp. CB1650]|uniref:hypothetical protein n=1 Tax=Bradyrhizobium sp. CB1650 TaxID=3039153 RepID=UPI0024351156|nr:hypothetical protein [Bradyrhizobium sp. CB1650]WGD55876.1 hypothetical protein QA641_19500 [Bradyrhizobium sp. CB1650]
MADEHLQDMREARRALVEMRRNWAKAIAGDYQRGKTEDAIKGIIEVQQAVEAIDRAIEDEGKLKSEGR